MPSLKLLVTDLLAVIPDAALLLQGGRVVRCNTPAQKLFFHVEAGKLIPDVLARQLVGITPPATIQTTMLDGEYQITLQDTKVGTLVLVRPMPSCEPGPQLSRVAQHLRQDMATLSAALQQLPMGDIASEKENQYVSVANQSIYRLHRLADQLDFAGRSDQDLFRPAPMDLASLCDYTANQLEGICPPEQWQFSYQSDCISLPMVADGVLIQRVIFTLVSNSIRANQKGVKLGLTLTKRDKWAVLTLWDQGRGISDPGQLFATVAHNPPSLDATQGVGLGLSAARRIVALHKGTMVFESPSQGGLRCTISLPIQKILPNATLRAPSADDFGGLSPLLLELSHVLSWEHFTPEHWEN